MEDKDLAAVAVNGHAGHDVDLEQCGVVGVGEFDQVEAHDDAPGVVGEVVAPPHVAVVSLLGLEVLGAEELALVVVQPLDLVGGHGTSCDYFLRRDSRAATC
ncbi:MAG: hypothetical protein M5U12_31630 [Verrucomicrobia bacterium]|nr:hypothetical protein [Verrucomicrobiota bacterium]